MVDGTFFHSYNHNDNVRVWYVGLVCCEKLNAKGTQNYLYGKCKLTNYIGNGFIHLLPRHCHESIVKIILATIQYVKGLRDVLGFWELACDL